MTRSPLSALALSRLSAALPFATLLLAASTLAAQDQPPATPPEQPPAAPPAEAPGSPQPTGEQPASGAAKPANPDEVRVDRPATVNGEAITTDEIIGEAQHLAEDNPGADTVQLQRTARALIAGQILLAAEAKRLGVTLPERDLDEYWERTAGRVPDYKALAEQAGISVERQTDRARRTALADLYLRHRIGLRGDYGRWIPPDPRLVRLVTLTPSQMREAFQENKALLDRPERVVCNLYPVADATAADEAQTIIAAGGTPPGKPPARRELPLDALDPAMPPELATFLREGAIGATMTAPAEQGVLVVSIIGREPAEAARFETSQETLRVMLMRDRMEKARRELIEQLRKQATYWPADLFDA